MDVFRRLAPFVQDYIYANGWTEFREIQMAACEVMFGTGQHLLLASGTSTGKTEAVFLPALTLLHEKPSSSVGILYVSPLKALINDQFGRLNGLLEYSDIKVHKWHGDVSAHKKEKLLRNPEGVLQITPESLESLMILRSDDCARLFSDLRFVIIDEVHYFMASERGIQLSCLMERLERISGCRPRRIGLSATINDYAAAEDWLGSGSGRGCQTRTAPSAKRKLRIFMRRFLFSDEEYENEEEQRDYYEYLYERTFGKKSIMCANSRAEVETAVANLRGIAGERKALDVYRVHHGSISAALREGAEKDMKASELPIVTGATVTLELGVDIGSLDMIVQLGAPLTASGLTQRIGRSGRRGQPAELLFLFREAEEGYDSGGVYGVLRRMNWDFLKTIAITQLFLEERWVEPAPRPLYPYSLLYHQTMSFLLSKRAASPAELARNILTLAAFKAVTKEDYQLLLRHLINIKHLVRTEEGLLTIGAAAEPTVTNYRFFAVFEADTEYEVRHRDEIVGSVMQAYPVGDCFALAGKAWVVVGVNEKMKRLSVQEADGMARTAWVSSGGAAQHTRVLEKMREILMGKGSYAYLSEDCVELLQRMRRDFKRLGLRDKSLLRISGGSFAFFPWLGTKQMNAITLLMRYAGIQSTVRPGGMNQVYLELDCENEGYLRRALDRALGGAVDISRVKVGDNVKIPGKFNAFVPKELLIKEYIGDYVDFNLSK